MEFIALHGLNQCIQQENPVDHDRKSVLSKDHGQLLHLAAIQHCVDQALHIIDDDNPRQTEWSYKIPKNALLKASVLLDYFIAQKFAISHHRTSSMQEDEAYDWHRLRRVLELPSGVIIPSIVAAD